MIYLMDENECMLFFSGQAKESLGSRFCGVKKMMGGKLELGFYGIWPESSWIFICCLVRLSPRNFSK